MPFISRKLGTTAVKTFDTPAYVNKQGKKVPAQTRTFSVVKDYTTFCLLGPTIASNAEDVLLYVEKLPTK